MTEMFGEAWSPMSVPDLAPDDDDDVHSSPHVLKNPFLHNDDLTSVMNLRSPDYVIV